MYVILLAYLQIATYPTSTYPREMPQRFTNIKSPDTETLLISTQWGLAALRTEEDKAQLTLKRRSGAVAATYTLKRHKKHNYWVYYGWHPKFGVRDVTFGQNKMLERFCQIASGRKGEEGEATQAKEVRSRCERKLQKWMEKKSGEFGALCFDTTLVKFALPNIQICASASNRLKGTIARRAFREPDLQASLGRLFSTGSGGINRRLRRLVLEAIEGNHIGSELMGAMSLTSELLRRYKFDINLICNYLEGIQWTSISYSKGAQETLNEQHRLIVPLLRERYGDITTIRLLMGTRDFREVTDTVQMFTEMPLAEIAAELPRQPNWGLLHELAVSKIDTKTTKLLTFEYPKKVQRLDGLPLKGGRSLCLPDTNLTLKIWGRKLRNCVGSYASSIQRRRSYIIGVKDSEGGLTEVTEWTPKLDRCIQAEEKYAIDKTSKWCRKLEKDTREALEK